MTEIEPQTVPLWLDGAPGTIDTGKKEAVVHRGDTKLDRAIHNVYLPSLTVYLPPEDINTGTAIIVCPGGGFKYLAIDKEGHNVAKWLTTKGVAGLVLKYRTTPHDRSVASLDGRRAMRIARSRAKEWKIDPQSTGFMGFSAGGHIASALLDDKEANSDDPIDQIPSRPDFMCMIYGNDKSKVTPEFPPTFIVHANDEPGGAVNISTDYFQALRAVGVPAEMHIFATGGHGFGLGLKEGNSHKWPDLFINWMNSLNGAGEID